MRKPRPGVREGRIRFSIGFDLTEPVQGDCPHSR